MSSSSSDLIKFEPSVSFAISPSNCTLPHLTLARSAVLPEDQVYLSAAWTAANISARGPMGAHYRVWGDGKQMVKDDPFDHFGFSGLTADQLKARGYVVWTPIQQKGSWISEGDTSTFMNLVDNGLRGFVHATWGGWGGRTGEDVGPDGANPQYASARFFGASQRDLAARFQWADTPRFRDANHAPVVRVKGALDRVVRAGRQVTLKASFRDPDGNAVRLHWWRYDDADTYSGPIRLEGGNSPAVRFVVPADARPGETIHLILEAADDGAPSLTRYQRVVLHVGK
jgi:hypothetical protein